MGMFSSLFGRREQAPDAATLRAAGAKVIDVRSRAEFQAGHVAGARNLDVGAFDFASAVGRLNKRHTYVVYCPSGSRSARAAGAAATAAGGVRIVVAHVPDRAGEAAIVAEVSAEVARRLF